AEHDWLTTIRLPPHAPDLNPVETMWSLMRRARRDQLGPLVAGAMSEIIASATRGPWPHRPQSSWHAMSSFKDRTKRFSQVSANLSVDPHPKIGIRRCSQRGDA
ncbi:transposase, partial [Streptomyces zaomyceticus]|uniref:transposase n=1 Tax=Streptomyces zaomyceticus TaxID=68286 RepID=UPI00367380A2